MKDYSNSFLMDPKIDFAFKQIFAGNQRESKIVLMDLINVILDKKGLFTTGQSYMESR